MGQVIPVQIKAGLVVKENLLLLIINYLKTLRIAGRCYYRGNGSNIGDFSCKDLPACLIIGVIIGDQAIVFFLMGIKTLINKAIIVTGC